jgi:Ca2+-transporting ATPase
MSMNQRLSEPWAEPSTKVLEDVESSAEKGLTSTEAARRLKQYGSNLLKEIKAKSAWAILTDQFKSIIVILLAAASLLSFVFGEWMEGIAIAVVIVINAIIGFLTEWRSVRSMEELRKLGRVNTRVRRDGELQEIPAQKLVPGDVVILEGGDVVTADLRLFQTSKLQAEESALTGESLPLSKNIDPVEKDTPLAERKNMLFKGTSVTRGTGEGVVVAAGMETELGRISSLVEEAEDELTPLEKRLNQLGHRLIWVTLLITAVVALTGILSGKEVFLMIETSVALAVAAIPEGLPIVATIALARGVWRMARRNALINRLSAVETLGATSIIFTDKTGTLTENRMAVTELAIDSELIAVDKGFILADGEAVKTGKHIEPSKHRVLWEMLKVGVLCNNASFHRTSEGEKKVVGEPLEVALLEVGSKAGIHRKKMVDSLPEVREVSFDPGVKMMATFHRNNGQFIVAVKGAPESVLDCSNFVLAEDGRLKLDDRTRDLWFERNEKMAEEGLRVIALAQKETDNRDSDPYENLTLLGLAGMMDPPREEVREAIDVCQKAGIEVIMVTGDQSVTAGSVAASVGLVYEGDDRILQGQKLKEIEEINEEEREQILQTRIFARISPEQKLNLIEAFQKSGAIVAMTGDGVNDAPALKKADIGVAMGKRGTQVASEAADMVLKDDAFSTIVAAIEQGRIIFNNIRKFAFYLLSCNVSEVISVAAASFINIPLPILPLQILFLNLVTDVFPALALGVGEGDPSIMRHPPRDPKEPILARSHWYGIGGYGLAIAFSVLGALTLALFRLDMDEKQAVSVSFLTLAFAQLWHVFNMRDRGSSLFRNEITRNSYVWTALVLCTGMLLLAVYLPGLRDVLRLADPGKSGWFIVVGMSLIPLFIGQIGMLIKKGSSKKKS